MKAVNGVYRMAITEPMSELAYLDRITLDVVDRPPGFDATPDERFAPGGKRPSGKLLLAWREPIGFVRATDLKRPGRERILALPGRSRVRRRFQARRRGWIGYAEEHGIVLDFGDRLAVLGPRDRVAAVPDRLHGISLFADQLCGHARPACTLKPPVLGDGSLTTATWRILEADPGYPAGMERMTTLELTGKLAGPSCVLRLRTNMEIGWDQAFTANLESRPIAELRVTTIPIGRAALSHRGYTREVSPDGRLPLIYDYDYVDPAPLANLVGTLTRFGDVAPLLRGDDDRLCVIGPGDEVRLEFSATGVPPLPEGWSRSYVLRAIGYCKDADPFTAGSDTVAPLPWRGMPRYPFGPKGESALDGAYRAYLKEYQTRHVGR